MKKLMLFSLLILFLSCSQNEKKFKCVLRGNEDSIYTIEVKGIDKSTFSCLDNGYAKDKSHVYFDNSYFPDTIVEGASPSSFKVFNNVGSYAQDKDRIYNYGKLLLKDVDNESFEILNYGYTKDKNHIYFNDKKLKSIDYNSFGTMDYGYAKDKNNVYYYGEVIEDADAKTFEVLYFVHSRDENSVYYEMKKIEDIDSETLEFFDFPEYVKDKNHVYYKEKILKGADSKTIKGNSEGKYVRKYLIHKIYYDIEDKDNYYKNGEIVKKK